MYFWTFFVTCGLTTLVRCKAVKACPLDERDIITCQTFNPALSKSTNLYSAMIKQYCKHIDFRGNLISYFKSNPYFTPM